MAGDEREQVGCPLFAFAGTVDCSIQGLNRPKSAVWNSSMVLAGRHDRGCRLWAMAVGRHSRLAVEHPRAAPAGTPRHPVRQMTRPERSTSTWSGPKRSCSSGRRIRRPGRSTGACGRRRWPTPGWRWCREPGRTSSSRCGNESSPTLRLGGPAPLDRLEYAPGPWVSFT